MTRQQINYQIRNRIIQDVQRYLKYPTRAAINQLAKTFNVPKQVISGNISWLVRSGQLRIIRCRPNSYLY